MILQSFLASRTGKRFYNFCYRWGACLVIMGVVSKIADLPYSNIFLIIGLITEVFIFFISGFDVPARDYKWEKVIPILNDKTANIVPSKASVNINVASINKAFSTLNREELTRMKENLKKLNKAYEKQIETLENILQTDMSNNAQQMSTHINMLNKQYKQMLDALNVYTEK